MFLQSRNLIIAAGCVVGCGIAAMVVAHDRAGNPAIPQAGAYANGPYAYSQPAQAYNQPGQAYNQTPLAYNQTPQAYDQTPQQITTIQSGAQTYDNGYYPALSRPVYVRLGEPEYVPPPTVAPEPVYSNQRVVYETDRGHRERRHHGRSKAHSVEIVAGSAGVGAAIGAIAGGGKGAAIGALAGGAGGFVYDRLTH